MNLSIGQVAPDFTLKDHLERDICLNDYRGQRNVVIAFFPLAWTPV
jgi:peroxiredoxin